MAKKEMFLKEYKWSDFLKNVINSKNMRLKYASMVIYITKVSKGYEIRENVNQPDGAGKRFSEVSVKTVHRETIDEVVNHVYSNGKTMKDMWNHILVARLED